VSSGDVTVIDRPWRRASKCLFNVLPLSPT